MTDTPLSKQWQEQLLSYERLWIGFSGGLDSTVLLHGLAAMPAIKAKITAIHINHGLSPNADEWQRQAQVFCQTFSIPFIAEKVCFNRQANIEEGARQARYAVFHKLVQTGDALLLAHHKNDQVETLLLHLFRGTGIDGLSAMSAKQTSGNGTLLRPLLNFTREQLYSYAQHQELSWVDDESNRDLRFKRNFLRQQVIPLLQQKWPALINNLAQTASHCAEAQSNLTDLAFMDYGDLKTHSNRLFLPALRNLSRARQINVLRVWFKNNALRFPSVAVVGQLLQLIQARVDAKPCVKWADYIIRRHADHLYLSKDEGIGNQQTLVWSNFPTPLNLGFNQGVLYAEKAKSGVHIPLDSMVEIRFRQGGEKILLHGQTKSLKKLMQEWQIAPWLRSEIPLIFVNQQLALIPDYAIGDNFYRSDEADVYQISLVRGN